MFNEYSAKRQKMVETQLLPRGIKDSRVLAAMRKIPRHLFLDEALWPEAYEDHPLPIGEKQTISQPFIVAVMTEALKLSGNEKILEIGTGSGYQAAILAELAEQVYSIERLPAIAKRARRMFDELMQSFFFPGSKLVLLLMIYLEHLKCNHFRSKRFFQCDFHTMTLKILPSQHTIKQVKSHQSKQLRLPKLLYIKFISLIYLQILAVQRK